MVQFLQNGLVADPLNLSIILLILFSKKMLKDYEIKAKYKLCL